jgi:hypothetical protein
MTEGTFGEIKSKGDFDEWDADNVAPTVAWLASDDAADVSGQVFVIWGGQVTLMQGWRPVNQVKQDHRWTVEELTARKAELFKEHGSSIPEFSFGGF